MSNTHEGVSCDSCLQSSFRGRRYKCLICYDFDLCATCYEAGITKQQHKTDHPMQCILTRADSGLYYAGETLSNPEQPQSFTCPYCSKMGFTNITLEEHVVKSHAETSLEVICPVCVTLPGGDPNRMTDDLIRHLTLEHRTGPRDLVPLLNEGIAIRVQDIRHLPGQHGPIVRGRARSRRPNPHHSAGPFHTRTSTLRDSVDPIAELLSHLSGVRRSASNTGSGTFQQLQMQWQLDRHVHATQQQLERLTNRHCRSHSAETKLSANGESTTSASVPSITPPTSNSNFSTNFLLAGALEDLSIQDAIENAQPNRSQFVRELMLSVMSRPKILKPEQDCANSERITDLELVDKTEEVETNELVGTTKQDDHEKLPS